MSSNKMQRGEIYYISYMPVTGSEQRGGRPAVIVSNDVNNQRSSTIEVVYLTIKPMPTHTVVQATGRESVALCAQISTVDKSRVGLYAGKLSAHEMTELEEALARSLSLRESTRSDLPGVCADCRNLRSVKAAFRRFGILARQEAYTTVCENLMAIIGRPN